MTDRQRFFAELNESMTLLRSERKWHWQWKLNVNHIECKWHWSMTPKWTKWTVWKKSSNYWLWNVVRVWFFLKFCCNHRSKRTGAVRSHRGSCGSSNDRVCLRSIRTTLTTEPSCALTWTIDSVQLTETRLRRWGTLEFTMLLYLTQTTNRSCSQFRTRGRNGKSDTQTTMKAIQRILHGAAGTQSYNECK